jgi:hypothetical protein
MSFSIMRTNYGGGTWHAPNVDLHHALLAGLGGGIAYVGVVCRSDYGFGLTSGLNGNFVSNIYLSTVFILAAVLWDMSAMMHEL